MKYIISIILLVALCGNNLAYAAFVPDEDYLNDRAKIELLQRDTFKYMWDDADPDSGMAYEGNFPTWEILPVVSGGTGFGIAAIVVAVDRGWITREQGIARIMKISRFLRDKTPRSEMHGAFAHWMNGKTGASINFGNNDIGPDIVETSFLMQGLLIARAYFNGPGLEQELRSIITELWEGVDWLWFTENDDRGMNWHWNAKTGFSGLRILGYNECLITYVLAVSSPTYPIPRKSYDYWTSGNAYQPKDLYGYRIEASSATGGPLFLTHYSFIGLDPRRMADSFVTQGYFVRNVKQTLSNRGYCIESAPAKNLYSKDFWGLTASQIKGGYAASEPANDKGTIAPTAALTSMPYTPQYSTQVLLNFAGPLKGKVWGKNGPYDAISLRDKWVSNLYLAIDQLPIVCMVENYRSGMLWELLMSDKDVMAGLKVAGIHEPNFEDGFPEAVVTVKKDGKKYKPDAYDIRRHPDTGLFSIPYWSTEDCPVSFKMADLDGHTVLTKDVTAGKGRNNLSFAQFTDDKRILTLTMQMRGKSFQLPVRMH